MMMIVVGGAIHCLFWVAGDLGGAVFDLVVFFAGVGSVAPGSVVGVAILHHSFWPFGRLVLGSMSTKI